MAALHIKFEGDYGWGGFPYLSVLTSIKLRPQTGAQFDTFQVVSYHGRPRLHVEGDKWVEGERREMHGVNRNARFTGVPLPSTVQLANETQLPVLEVSWPEGLARVYYPARYKHVEPYEGRVYEVFKSDCYSLVREYLMDHGHVYPDTLPVGAAEEAAKHATLFGRDFFMNSFLKVGFQPVVGEPQQGDVVICGAPNDALHAAVLLEGNRLLHHAPNRFSTIEPYDGYWKHGTRAIYRFVKGA